MIIPRFKLGVWGWCELCEWGHGSLKRWPSFHCRWNPVSRTQGIDERHLLSVSDFDWNRLMHFRGRGDVRIYPNFPNCVHGAPTQREKHNNDLGSSLTSFSARRGPGLESQCSEWGKVKPLHRTQKAPGLNTASWPWSCPELHMCGWRWVSSALVLTTIF